MSTQSQLPLDGLRVLDLGQIYNGAYAGFLLAQAGADVVKVEPPAGDNLRNRPLAHGAWYPFVALNVGKRSVCLDMKTEAGRERFLGLVAVADVVLENYSPGVMDRLGVGYDAMRAANPRLIYASSSGYGNDSRYRDRPAMDLTVQAMVGVTSVTGYPDQPPVKAGVAVADFAAGVHMYGGIVSALLRRERTGEGGTVEVAMFDAAFPPLLSSLAVALGTTDEKPERTGNRHGGRGEAPYNVYATSDGYVAIICVTDVQWRALADVIGGERLAADARFSTRALRVENIDALDVAVGTWAATRRRDDALEALLARGIPAAPVRDLREDHRGPRRARARSAARSRRSDPRPDPRVRLGDPLRRRTRAGPGAGAGTRRAHRARAARVEPMSGVRMTGRWLPLDTEHVERLGGHMGVYELAAADGEVMRIGFAGGRSVFGLRGELRRALDGDRDGVAASFRYEITTSYLSRYRELLMVHAADHGAIPAGNVDTDLQLGRLSPG